MKPEKTELLDKSLPNADSSESVPWTSYYDLNYAGDDVK